MDMLEIMKKEEAYCSDHRDMPGELQKKAKMLCWRYNQTSPEEGDVRAEILRELLGTCHPLTFIEPSFRCDYGFNIHTHGLTVINYNCVILDTSPVHIGENAFIAPGVCIACSGHSKDAAQRAAGIGTSPLAGTSGSEPIPLSAAAFPSGTGPSSGPEAWSRRISHPG